MVDIFKLKIGDVVHVPIYPKVRTAILEPGKVVYIHPKKRFFTVEFLMESGARGYEKATTHMVPWVVQSKRK